jgi:hypothetical protein
MAESIRPTIASSRIPVLSILDKKNHKKRHDRRAGIDHQLPGITETEGGPVTAHTTSTATASKRLRAGLLHVWPISRNVNLDFLSFSHRCVRHQRLASNVHKTTVTFAIDFYIFGSFWMLLMVKRLSPGQIRKQCAKVFSSI